MEVSFNFSTICGPIEEFKSPVHETIFSFFLIKDEIGVEGTRVDSKKLALPSRDMT